jgi:hypothetical protein
MHSTPPDSHTHGHSPVILTAEAITGLLIQWGEHVANYQSAVTGSPEEHKVGQELDAVTRQLYTVAGTACGETGTTADDPQLAQLRELWYGIADADSELTNNRTVGHAISEQILNSVLINVSPDGQNAGHNLYRRDRRDDADLVVELRRHWPLLLHHPTVTHAARRHGWAWLPSLNAYGAATPPAVMVATIREVQRGLHAVARELDQLPYARLANQLAADNSAREHTWDDLLATAELLTPHN